MILCSPLQAMAQEGESSSKGSVWDKLNRMFKFVNIEQKLDGKFKEEIAVWDKLNRMIVARLLLLFLTRFMEEKKRHSKEPGIIEGQYGNDMILSHHQIIANYAPGNLLTGFRFHNPYWPLDIADVSIVVHLVGTYQGYWAMDEAVTRVSDFFSTSCLVITIAAAVGCVAGVVLELKIKTYKPFKTSY